MIETDLTDLQTLLLRKKKKKLWKNINNPCVDYTNKLNWNKNTAINSTTTWMSNLINRTKNLWQNHSRHSQRRNAIEKLISILADPYTDWSPIKMLFPMHPWDLWGSGRAHTKNGQEEQEQEPLQLFRPHWNNYMFLWCLSFGLAVRAQLVQLSSRFVLTCDWMHHNNIICLYIYIYILYAPAKCHIENYNILFGCWLIFSFVLFFIFWFWFWYGWNGSIQTPGRKHLHRGPRGHGLTERAQVVCACAWCTGNFCPTRGLHERIVFFCSCVQPVR